MTVNELIKIIRDEDLIYYACIRIGRPKTPPLVSSYAGGAEVKGFFCDEDGMWREYNIQERGTIELSDKEFTEDAVCQNLLKYMRQEKKKRLEKKSGKMHLIINIIPCATE